ncbi:eukaryotic translation initiation factor 3 subunit B-like [Halichondria panicea]|uniref:eukaryotic translation initiation factor 3 subunit B-like n=1 Tax=Halichondria panicea TaxID=6063 RepID=UPI00312B6168
MTFHTTYPQCTCTHSHTVTSHAPTVTFHTPPPPPPTHTHTHSDFSWSPRDYNLAYWVPEHGQIPAKIIVLEMPSRNELSTKSRHLVSEFKLHWHKQGDFLAVRVDHFLNKSRKQLCYSLDIFHMTEPLIPVDTIEIKEPVVAFALEPQGSKLAVIHGEPPLRIHTTFYQINKGGKPTQIKTLEILENTAVNNIFWSPSGQFVVLANLKGPESGHLEFWDTGSMTLMNSSQHQQASDLEWDPSGRYVVTSVSVWKQKMDTGFCMWSFQGRSLYRSPPSLDKFCQHQWRPRPPTLLAEEHLKLIKKDQKKYSHMFEQRDRTSKSKASKELLEKRKKMMSQYKEYRRKAEQEARKTKKMLIEDGVDVGEEGQAELDYEEETLYILVNETKETVNNNE